MQHSQRLQLSTNASQKRSRLVRAAALALLTAACDDPPTDPAAYPATANSALARGAVPRPMPGERHFYRLAEQIPGFGGYFFDDSGNLIAYVTSLTQADVARAALQGELGAARRSAHTEAAGPPQLEIRQARFSFLQLAGWRDALSAQGFAQVAGMHFIDLRETENRIAVAVTDGGAAAAVRSLAAVVGVPSEVLDVTVRPMERDFALSLTDMVTPFAGGLKITQYESGNQCSMGFNTYTGHYFVTASHCTRAVGPDYSSGGLAHFFQPSNVGTYAYVGTESNDPSTFTNAQDVSCPVNDRCRWSDAAIIAYPSGVGPGADGMGKIYRVTNTTGSKEIDGTLLIIDEVDFPSSNITLDKIGQSTGWSWGTVFSTCANVRGQPSNVVFLCQAQVSAYADEGDSGAPVFLWQWDTVTLYGIVRGGTASYFTFSPLGNIYEELGYVNSY
jgi:hypothetical protein